LVAGQEFNLLQLRIDPNAAAKKARVVLLNLNVWWDQVIEPTYARLLPLELPAAGISSSRTDLRQASGLHSDRLASASETSRTPHIDEW
jgi:hypothetical protein